MKRTLLVLSAITALLFGLAAPGSAARQASSVYLTPIMSAADGSDWLLIRAEKVTLPGSQRWLLRFDGCDKMGWISVLSPIQGTQRGATWGPTEGVWTTADLGGSNAQLQIGETYTEVLWLVYMGPWVNGSTTDLRTCTNADLYAVTTNSGNNSRDGIIQADIPLPW